MKLSTRQKSEIFVLNSYLLKIGIDKNICKLSKHLVLDDDKFYTVDNKQEDFLWINEHEKHDDINCLTTLFKLERKEIDVLPPVPYTQAYKVLTGENSGAWSIIDSSHKLRWARTRLTQIKNDLEVISSVYHQNSFVPCTKVIESLRPWKVSEKINDSDDPTASTFTVDANGFTKIPTYNRFGTRTGRLTVVAGPRVLTARQNTRDLLRPISEDHELVSLDYSSLEARIALAIAKKQVSATQDPYEIIAKTINSKSREEAKNATFSALYSDPTNNERVDVKVSLVRRMFKLGETHTKLLEERDKSGGTVRNLYHRLIDVTGESTLYNNYVQSTGADVALHGFLYLLPLFKNLEIVPHFVLHDEIFVSVPKKNISSLSDSIKHGVNVPYLEDCIFPLKLTIIGKSTKV